MSREPEDSQLLMVLTSIFFWLFFLIYAFIFYFNLHVLIPQIFLKKKYLLYTALFVGGFVLTYVSQPFENLIFQKFSRSSMQYRPEPGRPPGLEPRFEQNPPPRPEQPSAFRRPAPRVDFVSLILFVVVWVVAMALSFSQQWRLSEKRVILSEADKAQAELSFFKAQINPHFLFNTLNNIYSLAVTGSEHTAPSILKLSRMMRYITDEASGNYVPLDEEVRSLEDYIDLQKLRLSNKTRVIFEAGELTMHVKIAPLILMTFVENAFKYGVSNRNESEINIRIKSSEKDISFFCQNQVFEKKTDLQRTGIGIANTRKRLDFLYPDQYELDIREADGFFTVNLKLTKV
ncbi:sensor histidine kinase [Dyadobacter luticola]|nr:histidine kinase [Dyadobacter luticola]